MSQGRFGKPPRTLSEQVALLQSRGMQIPDPTFAEDTLLRINYYRFSGYALHYEVAAGGQRTHRFRPGTAFNQVLSLYEFDSRLRALIFRYIEPVEIAFRTALCYEMAVRTQDSHWHLDRRRYHRGFDYAGYYETWERECVRSDEIFVRSYYAHYTEPSLPPAWMMTEILSMGVWSRIYQNLVDAEAKKAVAQHFMLKPYYLQSWIHALTVFRNLCAHHCRIVNRVFTIRPKLPRNLQHKVSSSDTLAAQVHVLARLLRPLGREVDLWHDWSTLLAGSSEMSPESMGFRERDGKLP